jgi:hypothetical protein
VTTASFFFLSQQLILKMLTACLNLERNARNFLKAGEWKILLDKLNTRLAPYLEQKKEAKLVKRAASETEKV